MRWLRAATGTCPCRCDPRAVSVCGCGAAAVASGRGGRETKRGRESEGGAGRKGRRVKTENRRGVQSVPRSGGSFPVKSQAIMAPKTRASSRSAPHHTLEDSLGCSRWQRQQHVSPVCSRRLSHITNHHLLVLFRALCASCPAPPLLSPRRRKCAKARRTMMHSRFALATRQ